MTIIDPLPELHGLTEVEEGPETEEQKKEEIKKAQKFKEETQKTLVNLTKVEKLSSLLTGTIIGLLSLTVGIYYLATLERLYVEARELAIILVVYGVLTLSWTIFGIVNVILYAKEKLKLNGYMWVMIAVFVIMVLTYFVASVGIYWTVQMFFTVEFDDVTHKNFCPKFEYKIAAVVFIVYVLLPGVWKLCCLRWKCCCKRPEQA